MVYECYKLGAFPLLQFEHNIDVVKYHQIVQERLMVNRVQCILRI